MTSDRIIALTTTVAKMQRQQILGTINRKAKSALFPYLPISLDGKYEPASRPTNIEVTPVLETAHLIRDTLTETDREYLNQRLESLKQGTVTFLNRSVETESDLPFSIHPLIGEQQNFPRLWTLKLLSLEPASWLALASDDPDPSVAETLIAWLSSWQSSEITSIGSKGYLRRYWTPYAVSRRIGNLARLMTVLEELSVADDDLVVKHLAKNVRFLSDHIERDIGGNHLLENGSALVIGGVLLNDESVIRRGMGVLLEELPSQLLDDGMHFERSMMYHVIILYQLTWALDVLRRSGREVPPEIISHIRSMSSFLYTIAPGTADYPLLNDSVQRECPSRSSCLSLVDNVFNISFESVDRVGGESGYYTIVSDDITVLVDGGTPCPDHLPGHAHNDIGNIVLWKGTEPIITDTGVYDYQPGHRRNYARSVAAHNTIQINDTDQTVTHGRFMMGPRPDPESQYISFGSRRGVRLYYETPKCHHSYTHERCVKPINQGIHIKDKINTGNDYITSRFHLTPGSDATLEANVVNVITPTGTSFEVEIDGSDSITVVETEYYPEYGVSVRRPTIEATSRLVTDEIHLSHNLRYQKTENNE